MSEWVLNTPLMCPISNLIIILIIDLLTCFHLARIFLTNFIFYICYLKGYKPINDKKCNKLLINQRMKPQPAITCSKLTIETLEQGVKYVQS